jgi:TBC1 domain family protein 5
MHELLAVCLMTVDRDSIDPSTRTNTNVLHEAMIATLDRRYVEHDAFALFIEIMKAAKPFYEWRAEEGLVGSQIGLLSTNIIPLRGSQS